MRAIGAVILLTTWAGISPGQDQAKPAGVELRQIQQLSRQIDELVGQRLSEVSERRNARIDDATFLRRIYLDVAGRIPTLSETKEFLASKDKHKRSVLIDQLLESPGYTSHYFNYWADILRVKTRLNGGNPGLPYIEFVRGALEANQPYDEFVRAMILAEGSIWEPGNGAAGYYLRDQGMPEDNMANTVRIFLGTRLECAQCHDHPFDKWTQRDFFEMVAFRGGVQTRRAPAGLGVAMEVRSQLQKSGADAELKRRVQRLLRPLSFGVSGGGTGLARLPDSYQYDDGEPNEIVSAKTLFFDQALVHPVVPKPVKKQRKQRRGRTTIDVRGAEDIGSRDAFADWLTSPDNPRFTMVIANRLWKRAMGMGLIEPVDDITDETVASNPALMNHLIEVMISLDYDMKQFLRVVFNSDTYQRAATPIDQVDFGDYTFAGPALRRMTAEQLWDSFLVLAVPNLDQRKSLRSQIARGMLGTDPYGDFQKIKDLTAEEIIALAKSRETMAPNERQKQIRKAMESRTQANNEFVAQANKYKREVRDLQRQLVRARRQRDLVGKRRLQERIKEISLASRHLPVGLAGDLVRASELPSPAPPGHFLREFGQSDREQIQNANVEPAATQALSLMNGQIEKRIVSNPRTVLMMNVVSADSEADRIDTVFLSMLTRHPTRGEKRIWLEDVHQNGLDAAKDLIWTLANTAEFMFVR